MTRTRRRAFTLVEMLASLTIMSLAFGAMLSASLLLTEAADPTNTSGRASAVGSIAADLAEELQTAVAISATANSVELTVPDRDSDAVDEVLLYQWSGNAGDPLRLSYNGAASIPVTGPLDAFSIEFETETLAADSEILIGAHNPSTIASPGTARVDNTNWHAQTFTPALPAGATGWKPTRNRIICQNIGSTFLTSMFTSINTVHPTGEPTLTAHTFNTIGAGSLPTTMGWHESSYSSMAPTIPAGDDVAFVVTTINLTSAFDVRVDTSADVPSGYWTGNSGGYTTDTSKAIVYEVYGIVYGASPTHARRAHVRLTPTAAPTASVEFGVATLNEPPVSGAAQEIAVGGAI